MIRAYLVSGIVGLICASAGAEPLNVFGNWSLSREIVPSFRVETVIQRDLTKIDKAELAQLRSLGYACVFVQSSTYRCRKSFFDHWMPSEDHRKQLINQFKGKDFEIVRTPGDPSVITSGNSVTQWQLPALAYNSQGKTDSVIYWEFEDGSGKLQFEIGDEEFWPHFESAESMNFRTYIFESKGKFQTQFYYDVEFTRR